MQVQRFLEAWIKGTDGITYTPGGLAWGNQWGTLRFVTNAAMIASVYAHNVQSASSQSTLQPACLCHVVVNHDGLHTGCCLVGGKS